MSNVIAYCYNTYLEILGEPKNKNNLVQKSYELQNKLSESKSKFANELLYQLSINEDEEQLKYIMANKPEGMEIEIIKVPFEGATSELNLFFNKQIDYVSFEED